MDDGQCEWEGQLESGGLNVDLQNNLSHDSNGPSPDLRIQNQEVGSGRGGGGGRGEEEFHQDSLNNNEDEEGNEEEEEVDHVMDEEEEGEESESSSVTRGQSPDTPMTDSSFSDTGSLVEFRPSLSPETTYPISPVTTPEELTQSDTSHTGPLTCPAAPPHCTSGPTSAAGSSSSTVGTTCATGPITSTVGPSCTTEPVTSITEPITTVGPTYTTGPIRSPALLACLQELGERGDDTHLPQYLHQIAEAFVLQEDFERAVWCIQLERLYHQRLLTNLSTLQEQWESHCRRSNVDLDSQPLERLTHICRTHQRPSIGAGKCAAVDSALKTLVCDGESPDGPLNTCSSEWLVESAQGMEEVQRDSPNSSSSTDTLRSNDRAAGGGTEGRRDSTETSGFNGDQLIDRLPLAAELSEGPCPEMDQTTEEGSVRQDPHEDEEMSQPRVEELGKEEEEVDEAEEALEINEEVEKEEQEEKNSPVKAPPEEILRTELKERLKQEDLHQEAQLRKEALVEGELREEARLRVEARLSEEAQFREEAQIRIEAQLREEAQLAEQEQRLLENQLGVKRVEPSAGLDSLDDLAKRITVEEITPASGLVSILKRSSVCAEEVCVPSSSAPPTQKAPAKRRVRFKVPDDGLDQDVTGGDSCLLLFLLCLVTVVISVGGTALYCALGDAHSSVCKDFSRNADFYLAQLHHGMEQLRHWMALGS